MNPVINNLFLELQKINSEIDKLLQDCNKIRNLQEERMYWNKVKYLKCKRSLYFKYLKKIKGF